MVIVTRREDIAIPVFATLGLRVGHTDIFQPTIHLCLVQAGIPLLMRYRKQHTKSVVVEGIADKGRYLRRSLFAVFVVYPFDAARHFKAVEAKGACGIDINRRANTAGLVAGIAGFVHVETAYQFRRDSIEAKCPVVVF